MNVSQRRDFTRDLNRSSGGYELAAAILLFGAIGFGLDKWLGIVPVLTIVFVIVGSIVAVVRLWIGYDTRMRAHEEAGPWTRHS